jgi:NAD(P)-dependent dehydrogenase (short-subunit alcohol dehydrogenase family)
MTQVKIGERFDLSGKIAVVTGGAGLLGVMHRDALAAAGATVISFDLVVDDERAMRVDITNGEEVEASVSEVEQTYGQIDILVNNAARNPKVEDGVSWSRLESFERKEWDADLAVGLTGAFLMSQAVGTAMANRRSGVILNICSDLAVIAPDQRLYRLPGLPDDAQPVKPVTYSVVKHALLGLTRYLATYWASANVRVNALSPGGVENGQDAAFVERLSALIPLGRMAHFDEYQGALLFLCSEASSYMTGQNLVVDGGRTVW